MTAADEPLDRLAADMLATADPTAAQEQGWAIRFAAAISHSSQPRERPCPCGVCQRSTWNLGAVCDPCLDLEANGEQP